MNMKVKRATHELLLVHDWPFEILASEIYEEANYVLVRLLAASNHESSHRESRASQNIVVDGYPVQNTHLIPQSAPSRLSVICPEMSCRCVTIGVTTSRVPREWLTGGGTPLCHYCSIKTAVGTTCVPSRAGTIHCRGMGHRFTMPFLCNSRFHSLFG